MADQRTDLDVVDELTTDHREALDILDRLRTTTDPEERRDLADTVIGELVRHSVAEEMYVYPAMREHLPDGREVTEHDAEDEQFPRLREQLPRETLVDLREKVDRAKKLAPTRPHPERRALLQAGRARGGDGRPDARQARRTVAELNAHPPGPHRALDVHRVSEGDLNPHALLGH